MKMRNKQLGIGLGGLLAVSAVLVAFAILGMKLVPSYLEFMAVKKVVKAIAAEKGGASTVAELRRSFAIRASVDAIESVKPEDIEITKDGGELVVAARYRKEIPLVANIGIHIDFAAVSKE
ncbi:MAG: DUF4845 domain-containing protein [Betaproteobacteria bacterium]